MSIKHIFRRYVNAAGGRIGCGEIPVVTFNNRVFRADRSALTVCLPKKFDSDIVTPVCNLVKASLNGELGESAQSIAETAFNHHFGQKSATTVFAHGPNLSSTSYLRPFSGHGNLETQHFTISKLCALHRMVTELNHNDEFKKQTTQNGGDIWPLHSFLEHVRLENPLTAKIAKHVGQASAPANIRS